VYDVSDHRVDDANVYAIDVFVLVYTFWQE